MPAPGDDDPDAVIQRLVASVPYVRFLGVELDRRGDELTAVLRFDEKLIGNPMLPALHGGVTAAFLEVAAMVQLAYATLHAGGPSSAVASDAALAPLLPRLPRTIGLTVDYLRSGQPRDAYARARVLRAGRRYASVDAEAWQDARDRPLAKASVHFLMPPHG